MRVRTLAAMAATMALSVAAPPTATAKTHRCPHGRPAGGNCGLHRGQGQGASHHRGHGRARVGQGQGQGD